MARWQNPGYGKTLGGAILSEGIATYYEELISGWTPPWAEATISDKAKTAARLAWNDTNYNHANWFFEGTYGRWVGYAIGYQLAKKLFDSGFELERSVIVKPDEVLEIL